LNNAPFIFDTGSPETVLPADTIQAIATDFGGSVVNTQPLVPCANIEDATYSISFSSTVAFTFPLIQLSTPQSDDSSQCQINLGTATGDNVIGANILTLLYTVFQIESNMMGFALPASSPVTADLMPVLDSSNLPTVTGVATS
jgi:hypothetical protein